jgi:hypothetical protein
VGWVCPADQRKPLPKRKTPGGLGAEIPLIHSKFLSKFALQKAIDQRIGALIFNMRTGISFIAHAVLRMNSLRKKDIYQPGVMCDWPFHNHSSAPMNLFKILVVSLLVCSCGGPSQTIDADVEVVRLLPSVVPETPANALLYRVVSPPELSGRYGTEFTSKTSQDVESRKGKIYSIRRGGKWREMLSLAPPEGGNESKSADFFDSAKEK